MESFNEWMQQIDNAISNICGLSYLDLPDYAYRDSFDAGCSPKEIVIEVLESAGFPFDY